MAFGLWTYANRTFLPRAFIDTVAAVDVPVGEAGDFGSRVFTPLTFELGTFSQQTLRGVARYRIKRRMVGDTGKFDARQGTSLWD